MNLLLIERGELSARSEVLLLDARATHLREVLCVSPGQFVRVGLIGGPIGRAEVLWVDGETVRLRCELSDRAPAKPRVDVVLALPRPKVLKRLWSQLATFGVGCIHLTNAKRVERFYFDSHAIREEVYRPRLLEGLAQARDTHLPEVHVHKFLRTLVEDVLDETHADAKCLIADPVYERSPVRVLEGLAPERRVLIAIGPEGGWDPFERDLFQGRGFVGVGLGARALRSDTAIVGLLAIVNEALRLGA